MLSSFNTAVHLHYVSQTQPITLALPDYQTQIAGQVLRDSLQLYITIDQCHFKVTEMSVGERALSADVLVDVISRRVKEELLAQLR